MISDKDQSDLGREIVATLGTLPGYGRILWWDNSGNKPLDGATTEWGIDVRTINHDSVDQRYDPATNRRMYPKIGESKNEYAHSLGLRGILGVLVVLNYRTDMAEVYAKKMPLMHNGVRSGVYGWRKHNAPRLLERVPFKNPFKDHRSPLPQVFD